MSKSQRFTPGSYLEVDDLGGGRKVVLVAKDGATFWDSLDVERVTPIVIHAELHPVDLGTLHDLVAKRGSNVWFVLDGASLAQELDLPPGTRHRTETNEVWIATGRISVCDHGQRKQLKLAPGF